MEQPPPAGDEPRPEVAADPPIDGDEPPRPPTSAEPPAGPAVAWADSPPRVPTPDLAPLPIEATLRTAMNDIGQGFWRLLAIGGVGFAPMWAAVVALGDNPLSTIVQFLGILPSAALLAAAGAIRADRRPSIEGSYRRAIGRLLDYFLANLLLGVIVVLVMIVPVVIAVVAIALVIASNPGDPRATAGIVLAMVVVVLVPVAYVSSRLALIGPIVVVEGLSVGESITASWQRTRRQVLRLLVVFLAGSIPGGLVALGAALLAFGLLSQPVVSGLIFGLGYAVAVVVVTCINVVAWERLGGATNEVAASLPPATPRDGETPAPRVARPTDRGPATAILLLAVGLVLVIGGSAAAAGKVGGWVDALSGQSDGSITYGVNGIGCLQLDKRTEFEAGELVHLVAELTLAVPAGQRLAYEVYADGELIDRGYEEPFVEETECLFYDLDTTNIEPAAYTFRYLWAAEVLAEGTFTIRP